MEQEPKQPASLPDNAYRELAPGEKYSPVMPASSKPKEVTVYSVVFGIVMAIVFSAAAAYLGLRVGQVFEAAIPIAIIAVGVGNLTGRSGMLGQNVIIQSIGSSSGVIVARSDLYAAGALHSGAGGSFLPDIPVVAFRRPARDSAADPFPQVFRQGHARKYPFPEATATTEVLVSGEKKGDQAKLLACSGLIGGLYDFAVARSAGGPRTSRRVWPSGERCWPIRRSSSSRSIPEPPYSVWAISSGSAMPRTSAPVRLPYGSY